MHLIAAASTPDPLRRLKELLPGNEMTLNGVEDANDRRGLIAYVAMQTQTPPTP